MRSILNRISLNTIYIFIENGHCRILYGNPYKLLYTRNQKERTEEIQLKVVNSGGASIYTCWCQHLLLLTSGASFCPFSTGGGSGV